MEWKIYRQVYYGNKNDENNKTKYICLNRGDGTGTHIIIILWGINNYISNSDNNS